MFSDHAVAGAGSGYTRYVFDPCQQYLGYDPRRQEMVASWMSGYFNASINQPVVSFERFDNNKRTVADYCRTHGYETLMSAIRQKVF